MVFPPNTAVLLEALKSSSNKSHLNGLLAELKVIKLYLEKGYALKSHRQKYYKTEIDIVMESAQKLVLIEVKYAEHEDFMYARLSRSQKRRLENVFLRVIHATSKEVEFHYVITSQCGEFHIIEDFLAHE
jgi:Holliday junction resolvase-like predicted endonuclease